MSYLKRMMKNPSCFGMARMYGAEPAAGFSPSRGVFSPSGSYGARMYGAMPGAGFSSSRGVFSPTGHYGAPKLATAVPYTPRPVKPQPAPAPGRQPNIFDGCVEFRRDGGVSLYNESGLVDSQSYSRTGRTMRIDGKVHHELVFAGDPTNPIYAPICLVEGTFRPIGETGQPPRKPAVPGPQVIDACVEVIRNGNGMVRVIFEDGNVIEPGQGGYVLSGNTVMLEGVKHYGISLPGDPNEVFAPLCLIEGTFVGPSTRPELPPPPRRPGPTPTVFQRPDLPPPPPPRRPEQPTPGVFVPPPPRVFNPPTVTPPPTRVPPTRVPPRLPPPTTGTPPQRHPVPPGVYMPQPVGPTAPVPVPTGPCEHCDTYGNATFNPVLAGYPDGQFCY